MYPHQKIEKKWQEYWKINKSFEATEDSEKKKYYCLDMFPYPSSNGLHVGHPEGYTATDIYSRYLRMNGYNVLHPMGWDAFGLPTENYAIKMRINPQEIAKRNIDNFRRQVDMFGFSYDWTREINTSSPDYYKWTQWIFLQLYKKGLAYKRKAPVNWCTSCQTVLANEQVVNGACERCHSLVIQKELEQWFLNVTEYAEELLSCLDTIDWPQPIKQAQRNWIGKSTGARLAFPIAGTTKALEVFTTRPDTLYGATYMVIAPEHPFVVSNELVIVNYDEITKYQEETKKKSELTRTHLEKEKTGIEIQGVKAVNPATGEQIPIWVADYVLMSYGTGAIMAVPAHDERDFVFAKKYSIPIKTVVIPSWGEEHEGEELRSTISATVRRKSDGKFLLLKWKKFDWISPSIGGIDNDETPEQAAVREVHEETGYRTVAIRTLGSKTVEHFFAENKNVWRKRIDQPVLLELIDEMADPIEDSEHQLHEPLWLSADEALATITHEYNKVGILRLIEGESVFTGTGVLTNSGEFDDVPSEKAKERIVEHVGGSLETRYKLRDWLISRQRYWGAPIPILYCETCGEQAVPEIDLPVLLPNDVDFRPTGESPLVQSKEFHTVKCPTCGKTARRESDTMDVFMCSSWYYLRYTSPNETDQPFDEQKIKYWMPVDMYVGGAEHAVLHLLYARFMTKALRDCGFLSFDEPFTRLKNQGLILGDDGEKMSKSRGNVVNPDEVVATFGADTIRIYEMFMGPFEMTKPWNTNGAVGVRRFLERIWYIFDQIKKHPEYHTKPSSQELMKIVHKTVKKVTEDIVAFSFNTAVSSMMICANALHDAVNKNESIDAGLQKTFLLILSPFAPHLVEELLELKGDEPVAAHLWPSFNPDFIKDAEVNVVIQINGKVRDQIQLLADSSDDKVKEVALQRDATIKWLDGKDAKKIIVVKNKLINFVI